MTAGGADATAVAARGPAHAGGPTVCDSATAARTGAAALRIVYCGGCNPQIDRAAIAAELVGPAGNAHTDERAGAAGGTGGPVVYLSGCARACASGQRLTSGAPGEIVVAGEAVDGRPTPAGDIAATILKKLKE